MSESQCAIMACAAALLCGLAAPLICKAAALDDECRCLCSSPSNAEMADLFVDDALVEAWQTRLWQRQPSEAQARVAGSVARLTTHLFTEPAERVPSERLNQRRHETVRGKVSAASAGGWTQILNSVEKSLPVAAIATTLLERELGVYFTINAYLHPPSGGGSQHGICAHSDPQEVIVVQLQGCRRWTVYDGPPPGHVEYPFENGKAQCFVAHCDRAKEAAHLGGLSSRSFELRAGSMLYIPWRYNQPHMTGPCAPDPADGQPPELQSLHWTLTSPGFAKAAGSFLFNLFARHLGEQGREDEFARAVEVLEGALTRTDELGARLRASIPRLAALRYEQAVAAAAHSLSALFLELFENVTGTTASSAEAESTVAGARPWLRKDGVFQDLHGIREALTNLMMQTSQADGSGRLLNEARSHCPVRGHGCCAAHDRRHE